MLDRIWSRLRNSEFSKNVSTQILGTGLAQVLPFMATPLLTRIYNEDDFAQYTSFFAIASIFAVAVGGKYYLAIVLPKEDKEATSLFVLSLYLTFAYSLAILFFFPLFFNLFPTEQRSVLLYVPLYVFFYGVWMSVINLSIRDKTFKLNAVAKVFQSIGYILVALSIGFSKIISFGLVVAKIAGTAFSDIFLSRRTKLKFKFLSINTLKPIALKYIDYPKFGIWPALLNTISLQALILILTRYYSTEDLGFFGLTYMVLSAPLALIGNSFKDVFYQKITELTVNRRYEEGKEFFLKSAVLLLILGLPVFILLYFCGEILFKFVFGDSWSRSGKFASILAFSFIVKLVVSPLSSIFNATNKLRIASIWQVIYFITTFSTLGYCGAILNLEVEHLLLIYVLHEIGLYLFYFILQYYTITSISAHNQKLK